MPLDIIQKALRKLMPTSVQSYLHAGSSAFKAACT